MRNPRSALTTWMKWEMNSVISVIRGRINPGFRSVINDPGHHVFADKCFGLSDPADAEFERARAK